MRPHVQSPDSGPIAARIREAREARKLSQADVARELNVSPSTPWRWEDGRHAPRRADRKRLADLLGVSEEWILHGTGDGPAESELKPTGTGGNV